MRRGIGRLALMTVAATALVIPAAQTERTVAAALETSYWPPSVLSPERALAATVRVDSRVGGVFDTGTGVGVGAHVVLTNAHLTRNPVTVITQCETRTLAVDRIAVAPEGIDVALVVTTGPPLLPVELAAADPEPGDALLLAGYPQGVRTLTNGRVEGVVDRPGGAVIRFTPEPHVGQSGSPLFDEKGRLVGLAFAEDTIGGQGLAIPVSRLRPLLDEFRRGGIAVAPAATGDPGAIAARSSPCP